MPLGAKTQPRLHIEGDMVRGQPQQNKSESRKSAGGPFQGDKFHLQGQVKGGMCSSPSIAPNKPAKDALIKAMSLQRELNPGPSVYKTDALRLGYTGHSMHAPPQALLKTHLKPSPADSTQAPTLLPDAWSSTWPWDCSACAKVTAVGFEPTRFAPAELESTPLDHSGKLSMLLCLAMATHLSMGGGCSKKAWSFLPLHVAGGHRVESTRSLPTSEVKQPRAWLVLSWGTAWKTKMLPAFVPFRFPGQQHRIAEQAMHASARALLKTHLKPPLQTPLRPQLCCLAHGQRMALWDLNPRGLHQWNLSPPP